MRRIKTWAAWDNGVSGRGISHRDYRLMRSVVSAAEQALRDPHFRGVFASSVQKAVAAYNEQRKQP